MSIHPLLWSGTALALLVLMGCEQEAPAPAQQRFVAVEAAPPPAPIEWCDKAFSTTQNKPFVLPDVVADQQAIVPSLNTSHWTWLNVWATWCGPCKEEMPMLSRWDKELDTKGPAVDLYFLSVDEDTDALAAFWAKNKAMSRVPTARLSALTAMEPWLKTYGLGANTSIPIHMLVAPGGKVRCIRTGSISEDDLDTIEAILAKG